MVAAVYSLLKTGDPALTTIERNRQLSDLICATLRSIATSLLWLLLACISHGGETTLCIQHCTVFDAEAGKLVPDQTIVIRGDRIASVTAADQATEVPADALQIDGRGKFALPGLIDAHVHLVHVLDFAHVTGDEVLPLYLAAGVTSVRSTGDEIVAATLVAQLRGGSSRVESPCLYVQPLVGRRAADTS